MKRHTSLSCLSIPAVTRTNKRSEIILNETKAIFCSKINYFLEIERISLQVMLTWKEQNMLQCWQKGACVYMCYIWFCSVINFAWKKCKKFRKIKWKWRIGFLTVLYCYIAVAIGFNILMWFSYFLPSCSASIIVTVRNSDFYFLKQTFIE